MRRSPPSPLRLGSIFEAPEYDFDPSSQPLDVEPKPIIESEGPNPVALIDEPKHDTADHADLPVWKRRGKRFMKDLVHRYCDICLKVAVMPCRTTCCSKLFCLEHIAVWGCEPNRRCPSCQVSCSSISPTLLTLPQLSTGKRSLKSMPVSKPDRPVLLLVLPDSESRPTVTSRPQLAPITIPPNPYVTASEPTYLRRPALPDSESRPTVTSKPPLDPISIPPNPYVTAGEPTFLRRSALQDSSGPCFHSNSGLVVLVGRMIGRVLSIVGLTLFLFVLLA